eukprot:scaffold227_cov165-Amphora_coffeaeformis.AAC.7
MGRVARFKKLKACDPYSNRNRGQLLGERVWGLTDSGRKAKKRSLVAQKMQAQKQKRRKGEKKVDDGFDLPPTEEDEFDSTTFEVQKKTKPLSLDDVEGRTLSQREAEIEEKRINKMLKIDAQVEPKKQPVAVPEKMPGEGKNAYRKRVQAETRQIIKDSKQSKRNPHKKQKKKEFLSNKKLKKKGGAVLANASDEPYDDSDDDLVTAEKTVAARALMAPRFGEQAERPPEFKSLPRGAPKKNAASSAQHEGNKGKKRKSMDDEEVLAEQQAMELMRRKVQAQYALVRQKRRGQFHL